MLIVLLSQANRRRPAVLGRGAGSTPACWYVVVFELKSAAARRQRSSLGQMVTKQTARDPKPTPERILQLASRVLEGDIILPEFQRPFVWKPRQVLELMDSVYRNYPIGSLLVWESNQKLASKRSIADLEVAERSEKYPVNYLLDGQQRLSAICGVIHWTPGNPKSVWNVVFDLKTGRFSHTDQVDSFA